MNDYLGDVFGTGGLFSKKFEGYTVRAGQIGMARAVDLALRTKRTLLAEGPTGTGKSLAYAVPATYHAHRHGTRMLITTSNIALQEQLISKDLPLLASILPWKFSYALIKGKNNYLCKRQFAKSEEQGLFKKSNTYPLPAEERYQQEQIIEWSRLTRTGDRSELPFEPVSNIWSRCSVGADDCTGRACRNYNECFSVWAKNQAAQANVMVTNYHLLFADLMTGGSVIPQYDILILDEGHKAANIARDFMGFNISEFAVRHAVSRLSEFKVRERVIDASKQFFADLREFKRSKAYHRRLRQPLIEVYWEGLREALDEAVAAYREQRSLVVARSTLSEGALTEELAEIDAKIRAAGRLSNNLLAVSEFRDGDTCVYYLEENERGFVSLRSKPVNVGGLLAHSLFSKTPAVVTSATLTDGNSFEFIAGELGLRDYDTYEAETPFQWQEQAFLVTANDMPDPADDRAFHREAMAKAIVKIIDFAQGRTLALFTSIESMKYAYDYARKYVSKYKLFVQGQMPRMKLIEAFKNDTHSVLFGTDSFWEGIDVAGESLSCVVMEKIPFPSPDDPVLDLRTEQSDDWFRRFSLPIALIAFRQGFGRLIRTVTDKGVVVVLDPRIMTKGYGKLFLDSLPDIYQSVELEDILEVLPHE